MYAVLALAIEFDVLTCENASAIIATDSWAIIKLSQRTECLLLRLEWSERPDSEPSSSTCRLMAFEVQLREIGMQSKENSSHIHALIMVHEIAIS